MVLAVLALVAAVLPLRAQSGEFAPPPIAAGTAEGRATLSPSSPEVGSVGTFVVRFIAGGEGIPPGGGLLVDFPKAWFANPVPLVKAVQLEDSAAPHFLGARASRPDVRLDLAASRRAVSGKVERFRRLLWVKVAGGYLYPEGSVEIVFANTTAPTVAGKGAVRIAVDTMGDGTYRWIAEDAGYEIVAAPAEEIRLLGPSQAVLGQSSELALVAFDRFANVASGTAGLLSVSGLDEEPLALEFGPLDGGVLRFRWTPRAEGWVWPAAEGSLLVGRDGGVERIHVHTDGGPIRVFEAAPDRHLFWGDLHSHSEVSKDAIGEGSFAYARDAARLDFFASTEHAGDDGAFLGPGPGNGITEQEWAEIKTAVRAYDEPGRFVTLLAYECSLADGHHNVFFRDVDGTPHPAHEVGDLEGLWRLLRAGHALTVPHHLGIGWGLPPGAPAPGPGLQDVRLPESAPRGPRLDWRGPQDDALRPLLEIYSGHGQSELYAPDDPLSYESLAWTPARSGDGPHYARDAWAAGLQLGTVAASDDHTAHPGLAHTGLTAVYAPALTREAVFDALLERRSYATTGERIVLDFTVSGAAMGSSIELYGPADGTFEVAAPSAMRFVEIMAYDHRDHWWRVARWDDPGRYLSSGFVDSPEIPTVYYLRVELEAKTGGRVARAWSSPVWVHPVLPED